jgi:hypothetical protein
VPEDYGRDQDPLDIFRFAGIVDPELTALIERELTNADVKAAETADARFPASVPLDWPHRRCR